MRLAKINIRRRIPRPKTLTSKSPHKNQKNDVSEVVGAFWFLEEELSLDKAREMARRLELTGSQGITFFGSSERIYKAKRKKQNTRVSGLQRNKFEAKPDIANNGRSYGFPLDDNDDDHVSSNEELSEIMDYPHKPTPKGDASPNANKNILSPPMSPPTSQDTQQDSSGDVTPTKKTFQREESTPPMPGSFISEEEPLSSPAFSSTNTDNHFTINDALYGTPRRPNYTNPGIAIEPRYNSRSPLPPPAPHGDMTPRQLAIFARRKYEFERLVPRSTTPSLMNESLSDEYKPYSDKELAEKRRRKRDLEKWREEKEALIRESEKLLGGKAANKDGRGRERDVEDAEDVEMEDRPAKRSKSSNFFNSLLTEAEDEFNMSTTGSGFGGFGNKSTEGSQIHSPAASSTSAEGSDTERETSLTTKVKHVLADKVSSKTSPIEASTNLPKSSFEVPTPSPSPSPPLQPVTSFSKSISSHVPKVPSRLRNNTIPSSPAGSPQKVHEAVIKKPSITMEVDDISAAVLALLPSKLLHFEFPSLGPQPRSYINTEVIMEISS